MERIGFAASEEMSFENVDGRPTDDRRTDRRTMDVGYHSNQSPYPTGIKNITFVEGNVLCICFSYILLTVSENKNFEYFSKIYPL